MSDDVPDPATGLSPREKKLVRATWDLVKPDLKAHGPLIIQWFIRENPDYHKLFSGFASVPISELGTNKKAAAHGNTVLYALTALVDNLDDPEVLVEMLAKNSASHYGRGITIEMYQNLGKSILGYLAEKLGPANMNEPTLNAWKKTYGVIVSVIQQGYDKAAAK